ncbi:MAG: hypothetical protein EXR50_08290 [Dehalococcoidia bacterium]|nr:hypothetical protein [Dehalococcoidia bacterium]
MHRLESVLGPFSLVTGGLGLAALVVSGLIYVLLPEIRDTASALFGLSLVLAVFFILGSFEDVKRALVARQARYGTNTLVMVVAFIGIAGAINFISANNHKRFDLTASGQFTLSRQTLSVLKSLDQEVKVVGFFPSDPQYQETRMQGENLLKEYTFHTDKLSYEFIDPDEKPAVARQYEARSYGAIVFDSGARRKQVVSSGEQEFTGAILNVTGKEQPRVYVLSGHGEHDVLNADARGLSLANDGLGADNYQVQSINLATEPKIPEDAAILIIAGPQKELLDQETGPIQDFLLSGGKMLIMVDPNLPPGWRNILAMWGVRIEDGYIVDQTSYAYPDIATPAAQRNQYYFEQITKDLSTTFFPGAAGIIPAVPPNDSDRVKIAPLMESSPQSWLEKGSGEPRFTGSEDIPGPLPLALLVEASAPIGGRPQGAAPLKPGDTTRIVVFSDSDFASNEFFYSLGNSDLLLNTVNYLTSKEELISIRPKPTDFRRIIVTQRAWNWILYSSVLFLPAAVLMIGGVSWWRRR